MGRLFDEKIDAQLEYYMAIFGQEQKKFVIISKLMRPYTPKQLSNRWRDYAGPRSYRKPLGNDEKNFVTRWIQNNRPGNNDVIPWTKIVCDLEAAFNNKTYSTNDIIPWTKIVCDVEATFNNKTYSTNDVKNFWYSNMRKKGMIKKREATKPRIRSHHSEKVLDFNHPETDVIRPVETRPKDFILTTPINLSNPKPNQFDQNQFIPCDLSHFTPQFNPTATPEGHHTTHTSTPYESKFLVEEPVESGFIAGYTTTTHMSLFKPYKPIARRHTADTFMPYGSQFPVEGPRSMPVESAGRTMTRTSRFMPYRRHTMPGSLPAAKPLEPQITPAPDFPDFNVSSINSSL